MCHVSGGVRCIGRLSDKSHPWQLDSDYNITQLSIYTNYSVPPTRIIHTEYNLANTYSLPITISCLYKTNPSLITYVPQKKMLILYNVSGDVELSVTSVPVHCPGGSTIHSSRKKEFSARLMATYVARCKRQSGVRRHLSNE